MLFGAEGAVHGLGDGAVHASMSTISHALSHRLVTEHTRLALAAGDAVDVPLTIASLVRDRYLSAMAWGWADIDWAGLAKVSAVEAGLERA